MREAEETLIHDLSNKLSCLNGQLLKLKKSEDIDVQQEIQKMEENNQSAQKLLKELRANLTNKRTIH